MSMRLKITIFRFRIAYFTDFGLQIADLSEWVSNIFFTPKSAIGTICNPQSEIGNRQSFFWQSRAWIRYYFFSREV
jgi:hypothetical protein